MIVVIHTYLQDDPDETIRIISARRATRHERREYES
ncbi:MAG: BrnT family toxin [Verrucomicrobiae bacterium]|nr:BrnT family toxin [Verrucomicrobiae bacterium]